MVVRGMKSYLTGCDNIVFMNEILKRAIDRLIEQIHTPSPVGPWEHAENIKVLTTRTLSFEHLIGVLAVGLALGGMTRDEMLESIGRANDSTKPTPPPTP